MYVYCKFCGKKPLIFHQEVKQLAQRKMLKDAILSGYLFAWLSLFNKTLHILREKFKKLWKIGNLYSGVKKGNCKIVKGEEEGKRYENEQRTFFFFACHFLKPLKFVWGVPNWKFLRWKNREMGNFLTSPTFDCPWICIILPRKDRKLWTQSKCSSKPLSAFIIIISLSLPPCLMLRNLGDPSNYPT